MRSRDLLPLLLGLLVALGAAGCSRAVEGRPAAAPAAPATETTNPAEPSASPTTVPARPSALEPDVLADECLLDAAQLAALLGRPVRAPEQVVVSRDDGSRSSGCYVTASGDDPAPLAAINVYRVRSGTPVQFVRAAAGAGRALPKVGKAAAVFETAAGPTLQVADARFLVTVVVHAPGSTDKAPDDKAWRAAAQAALARLPD